MADRPLLNPVLTLRVDPSPKPTTGGGKKPTSVVRTRLPEQMRVLGAASRALTASRAQLPTYNGKTHLIARMFAEDSLASTHKRSSALVTTTPCFSWDPFHPYPPLGEVKSLRRDGTRMSRRRPMRTLSTAPPSINS